MPRLSRFLSPNCNRGLLAGKSASAGASVMVTESIAASFVARIWLEEGPNGKPRWRGHVRHVQTDRGGFFDDLQKLRSIVEELSGVAGPALQANRRRGCVALEKAHKTGMRRRSDGRGKRAG